MQGVALIPYILSEVSSSVEASVEICVVDVGFVVVLSGFFVSKIEIFLIAQGVQQRVIQMKITAYVDEIIIRHTCDEIGYDFIGRSGHALPVIGIPVAEALNGIVEIVAEDRGVALGGFDVFHKAVIQPVQQRPDDFIVGTV